MLSVVMLKIASLEIIVLIMCVLCCKMWLRPS